MGAKKSIKFKTREQWLNAALKKMGPLFKAQKEEIPENIQVSCGWPNRTPGKSIGQCFDSKIASNENFQIFISPVLGDPVRVLGTLVHEVVHAVAGLKEGHKGKFRAIALKVGLTGKMTATTEGEELTKTLKEMSKALGEYPHGAIAYNSRKKERPTRVKLVSPEIDGYHIHISPKWLESYGVPNCPVSGEPMVLGDW